MAQAQGTFMAVVTVLLCCLTLIEASNLHCPSHTEHGLNHTDHLNKTGRLLPLRVPIQRYTTLDAAWEYPTGLLRPRADACECFDPESMLFNPLTISVRDADL